VADIAADAAFGGDDEINEGAGGAVGEFGLRFGDGGPQIFSAAEEEAISSF